jgi:4-hydroxy-2-oxoheptanedioate aldolase
MRQNHVKRQLQQGRPALGAWLSLASLPVARLLAHLGFDWLAIDMEHSPLDPATMTSMVMAVAEAGTCAPFVRVPDNSVEWFKWALDAGAWGVIVPMVSTRTEAEQAAQWARYPPQGRRSVGGIAAPYSFGTADRKEYARRANEEILVIVQIENAQALDNIDAICSVPGVDVVFVGPNDLRTQLGLPTSSEGAEPVFVAALERIKAAARRYNLPLGIYSSGGQAAAQRITEGFGMVSVVSDSSCLSSAASQHLALARGSEQSA